MRRKADVFTYLVSNPLDDWGIELTTTGYQHSAPHAKYPPPGHPRTHAFGWKQGRELDEYHLVYIPTGSGCFETRHGKCAIAAGDLMLIYKSEWHRYKPTGSSGWESFWVGFKGSYVEQHLRKRLFTRRKSWVCRIGYRPDLIGLFDQLIELSRGKSPHFKTASLGCLLQIVAYATTPEETKEPARADPTIADAAIAFIRQNLFIDVDFHAVATSFNLSYSRFRSLFKNSVGVAPHQFLLSERIACAKRMLKNPDLEVKTVGYQAGFRSPSYFSKVFRRKTGITPSAQRARRV